MQKPTIRALNLLAAGALFLSSAHAQQTQQPPGSTTQNPQAAGTPQTPATAAPKKPSTTTKTGQASARTAAPLTLKTQKDKVSYAIGMNEGRRLTQGIKQSDLDVDQAIILRAIKDALSGSKFLLTDQEAQTTLTNLQADIRKKQELMQQQAAENNKKDGEAFLAVNKTKEGVQTLPSGLQYKVLEEGTGPKPALGDMVTVNYRGTLVNGTEFDSSYKRGQPAAFAVGQVVKGWNEALQLMPVGSKWELYVPSDLAYGAPGRGPVIGPNATLIFEVELLSIQPKAPPAPTPMTTLTKP